jgi:hypothetical protein
MIAEGPTVPERVLIFAGGIMKKEPRRIYCAPGDRAWRPRRRERSASDALSTNLTALADPLIHSLDLQVRGYQ